MSRAERLYGAKDLDALFAGGVITSTPWQPAGSRHGEPMYDQEKVNEAVRGGKTEPTDPRHLKSTQGHVTYAGVKHYMHNTTLYKDQHQAGNQHPVVYHRGEEALLLSGHHRATKALLNGEQFQAIHVRPN